MVVATREGRHTGIRCLQSFIALSMLEDIVVVRRRRAWQP